MDPPDGPRGDYPVFVLPDRVAVRVWIEAPRRKLIVRRDGKGIPCMASRMDWFYLDDL